MGKCAYECIFIILVTYGCSSKVSQEVYSTFADAQKFIESREGFPQKVSSHLWRSDNGFFYEIVETYLLKDDQKGCN